VTKKQEALITDNLGMAVRIAQGQSRRLPACFTVDELTAAANLGLVKAALKYNPKQNSSFPAYATRVVAGAVIDSVKRRAYREATHEPIDGASHPTCSPKYDEDIDLQRQVERLNAAIEKLPGATARRLRRWMAGQTYTTIARACRVSTSEVSADIARGIVRLRAEMGVDSRVDDSRAGVRRISGSR
jgi:RNA polymerase sigma factor (sigma-70 family)